MSREQVDRLVEFAKAHPSPKHGIWIEFAKREGVSKDAVLYWRRKLGLSVRRS